MEITRGSHFLLPKHKIIMQSLAIPQSWQSPKNIKGQYSNLTSLLKKKNKTEQEMGKRTATRKTREYIFSSSKEMQTSTLKTSFTR